MNQPLSTITPPGGRSKMDAPSTNGRSEAMSTAATILLVDDNQAVARAMEIVFRMAGHRLDVAPTPEDAFSRLAACRYNAILLDMNFSAGESSGSEGMACLARIMSDDPNARVVIITAHSGIRIAVAAMQAGASDFMMKPWRNAELIAKVEGAIARGATVGTVPPRYAESEPARLLGESTAMHRLRDLVRRIAPSPAGVTITGLPGSGRTLTALAIHAASPHADTAPIRIDLRDAAAWARLDDARDTTILRHPDELDAIAQSRLLDRLSPGLRCIAIARTVAPLTPALRRRLCTIEIPVPPLTTRDDDAVLLARHFARVAADRFGQPEPTLSEAAVAAIRATVWPDDVRGLALTVERAVLLSDGGIIDAAILAPPTADAPIAAGGSDAAFDLTDAERTLIEAALREHRHNVTHAATALGLSRGALYRRMARYGL